MDFFRYDNYKRAESTTPTETGSQARVSENQPDAIADQRTTKSEYSRQSQHSVAKIKTSTQNYDQERASGEETTVNQRRSSKQQRLEADNYKRNDSQRMSENYKDSGKPRKRRKERFQEDDHLNPLAEIAAAIPREVFLEVGKLLD